MRCFLLRFTLISLSIVLALVPIQVSAEDGIDETFYSGNDILFYDPGATPCTRTGTTGGDVVIAGKNAETILRYFTSKGLTLEAAAGFAGNMNAESGLNPAVIQGGAIAPDDYNPVNTVGFGLVQWTFTSRQKPLQDLATSTNRKITDIDLQLDYVWQELTSGWKATLQTLEAKRESITPVQAAIIIHGKTDATRGDPRFVDAPEKRLRSISRHCRHCC